MKNDLELVKELKNGTKNDKFFKEKIILELKNNNYSYNQTTIDDILKEALDTYKEDTKIPFLFHIKKIIKNRFNKEEIINTDIFSKFEYKVLSLYLNKDNNIFLSKEDIAGRVSYPRSFIEEIITKFENMDSSDIKKVFPNYEKNSNERKEYFYHLANDLKEDDIELIGYYIGGIGDKALNIYELATKYGTSSMEIKKRLIKVFNTIKRGNNLELVLKRFKGKKNILYKKARFLGIRINDISITDKEKQILNILREYDKGNEIDDLISEAGYKNRNSFIDSKNQLLRKIKFDNIYKKQALEIYPELSLEKKCFKLSKNEQEMLRLLNEYHDKLISKDKMAELSGKKNSAVFINSLETLRKKVDKNPTLEKEALKIYPLFKKDKRELCELLSDKAIKILTILNEKQDSITDEEITKILNYKTVQTYKTFRYNLFNKINSNNDLKLHILKFFPTIKLNTVCLSDREKELISLLDKYKDNPLSNEEMAKKLGYKTVDSYNSTKTKLFKKLRENEETYKEALKICPSLNLEKNTYSPKPKPKLKNRVPVLSERDKEILQVLNEYKDNPLSNSEMAKRLGYKNANSYTYTKSHLIKKIRENANLKEEVSIKYPFVSYEINRNKIDFNAKDIYILKKYTLVKNNNLIYNSVDNIANFTSKSKHTIYYHIDRLKDKVISNLENNIDLNTALWPNFIEAFIARNNFSIKKSIKVNEEDLHSISDTETTKDKILLGVNKLEESIFSEYVSKCDFKDKLILAFRLGYFNKRFFTSNEVANILNTDENYVIELTKDCLSKSKEAFITYNKVLSKTKK